jgi:hypothetical protein
MPGVMVDEPVCNRGLCVTTERPVSGMPSIETREYLAY